MELLVLGTTHNHILDEQIHPTLTTQYLMDHIQQNHHTLTNPVIQDSIP